MDLPLTIVEPTAPHTHTIVFLHGRGDNAKNFRQSLNFSINSEDKTFFEALPSVRWVLPEAPITKLANGSCCWNQWFDTWSTNNLDAREEIMAPGLKENVPKIRNLLAAEAEKLGGRWDHVVLAGISQGGAIGGHVLMNLDVPKEGGGRLGAVMAFSGRCPFGGRPTLQEIRGVLGVDGVPDNTDTIRNTPVLIEHCLDDPVVPISYGRLLRDTLANKAGATVLWKEYQEGGHWFQSPDGLDDAIAFLKEHVLSREDQHGDGADGKAAELD